MAYNFPDSPSNGDTFTLNCVTYTYNSTKGVWKDTAVGVLPATVTSSDTAPTSPRSGDLWYRTDDSTLYVYYNDGSSSQWVGVSGPAGPAGATGAAGADGADGADGSSVVAYANFAAVPTSGNTVGDFGFTSDTKALYMWDGTEWDRVALGNDESPVVTTEPPTTEVALNSDGTTSTITMVAEDPEGFGITYGIAYKTANNARPSQLSADTTINQSTGVYTFTPTTTESSAGSFRARLSASDGARITTRFVDFSLNFYPIESTALLARYEFYDTNSYNPSTSTTALNDTSGNGNNQTISNPGTHTGTGNMTFTGSTSISFSGLTSAKAWCIIHYPTSGWNTALLFNDGGSASNYYATFSSGQTNPYASGYSAHSGATIVDRVNGTDPAGQRDNAYAAMDIGSMNSIINSGTNMSTGMQYNTYSGWSPQHLVRAMVFFNRELTLAEMEALHNYYRERWIAAGGTMPTWGN